MTTENWQVNNVNSGSWYRVAWSALRPIPCSGFTGALINDDDDDDVDNTDFIMSCYSRLYIGILFCSSLFFKSLEISN